MERYSVHSMKRLSTKGTCPQVHSIGCISFTLCSFALLLFTSHLLSFYLALFDVWEQSSLIYWGASWSSARARVMGVNWSLCYLSINFVAPFHRAVVGWSHSFFFLSFSVLYVVASSSNPCCTCPLSSPNLLIQVYSRIFSIKFVYCWCFSH